tara:strand:+ start:213 stop:386 length:174 start_codon:yes stop_codon:yes gene_type:complete
MKKLGLITGVLIVVLSTYGLLRNLGVLPFLPSSFSFVYTIPNLMLGIFIILLSSKFK